jgi:hypothetical protein
MNAQTKHEHIIRERFTRRLKEWWQEDDAAVVATAVDELMTDLGYVIKKPSIRKADPEQYRMLQREYMRAYQRRRRAEAKKSAIV